jgi:hypothetical protein
MAHIGICGDNCDVCPRFQATASGSIKRLEEVKSLWVKAGLRDSSFPVSQMQCHGCSAENKCAYPEIMHCAGSRKIQNCGECSEYICDRLKKAFVKTEKWESEIKEKLSDSDYQLLDRAFGRKREYLDEIHLKNC